jgi:serine/threonine protein kinase
MGCVLGKSSAIEDSRDSPSSRQSSSRLPKGTSSRRESFRVKEKRGGSDGRPGLNDKKLNGLRRVRDDHHVENRNHNSEFHVNTLPRISSVPKAIEGEQVAAGWPSWLASVAGEALQEWLPRRADSFEKLKKIGQGTYSSVYLARDLIHKKDVALKRVRFDNMDLESVKFMAREILILRKLDHPNIIKLEGLVTSRSSCSLYLVFEYMEHDLTGLASLPGVKFTEPQVKCYMKQLLSGLEHCHSRGVLHRDIKGSNLLIDNNGILKIADFGLASFYEQHNAALTSRVVTLWYRPPELLLGATHYGVSVDLWSTGCILGELYAGKPIMPGRTEVEQLHKIFKLCGSPSEDYWKKSKLPHSTVFKPAQPYKRRLSETFKDFPCNAIRLMEILLAIDPSQRGSASFALNSEYFTSKPLACDPSSLPTYPPSKEIDAKLRDEEAKRQRASGPLISKAPRAVPAPDANAELAASLQKRGRSNPKSRTELFNPHQDAATGFPIDPPNTSKESNRVSYSGPLGLGGATWSKHVNKQDDISTTRPNLSTLSGLVASRTSSSENCQDLGGPSQSHTSQLRSSAQITTSSRHTASGRASTKELFPHGGGFKGNKNHFSGPLLAASNNNMDQMLKEHDRQIQEAARRARLDKARIGKFPAQQTQNPLYVSTRNAR